MMMNVLSRSVMPNIKINYKTRFHVFSTWNVMLPQDIENTLDKPSYVKPCGRGSDRRRNPWLKNKRHCTNMTYVELFRIPVDKIN